MKICDRCESRISVKRVQLFGTSIPPAQKGWENEERDLCQACFVAVRTLFNSRITPEKKPPRGTG